MLSSRCARAVTLIAVVVCAVPTFSRGDDQGHNLVSINRQKYSYDYHVYSPPREIDGSGASGNETPLNALRTFFFYMKSGDIASWRKLWIEGSLDDFKVEEEVLLGAWKARMSQPEYLTSEVRYRDLIIFTTEKMSGKGSRRNHFLKSVAGRYFFVKAAGEDPFTKMILANRFDPVAGKHSAEPIARYEFERARQFVELEDTSDAILSGTDHSINNAKGYNVSLGEGHKGRGLVFEGSGYVEMPRSIPLSLYRGQVFMQVAVNVKEIPRDEGHRDEKGQYRSVILERGRTTSAGRFSLEAILGSGDDRDMILRFSVGDGDGEEHRYMHAKMNDWHHVSVAYSKDRMDMTVDGKEASLGSGPGKKQKNVNQPFDVMYLGRSTAEKPFFFFGSIDELAISNDPVD